MRVTIGRTGPGGGGSQGAVNFSRQEAQKAQRGPQQPKAMNHRFHGFHGLRILQPRRPRKGVETKANEVNEESRFGIGTSFPSFRSVQKKSVSSVSSAIRGGIFARLRDGEGLQQKNCGADNREMHENRAAFVRVFRVVRGENASFLSLLSLFAANSMEVPMQQLFTRAVEFSRPNPGANPVKPSQTQSNHFFYFDHEQPS
jgi:hypothetical protein